MSKANIMIVEDNAIIAMDLESHLKRLGYGITEIVPQGESVIEKAKADKPDLFLVDIVLKGKMDGIDVAEAIRNEFDLPVIFLTAFADQERLERAKLTYPFGFIVKPFQDKELQVTIEMALYVAKVDAVRKKAEESIRKHQIILKKAEEIANQGAWEWDIVKDEWTFSENWLRIHGCQTSGITRSELMTIAFPDDATKIEKSFQDALNGTIPYNLEHRIVRQDNKKVRWVKASGEVVFSNSGLPLKMYGSAQDITERMKADMTLLQTNENLERLVKERTAELENLNAKMKKEIIDRKSTEAELRLYREIIENMAEGVYLIRTSDGTIVYTNSQFDRMFKYDFEELIGKHLIILNAPTEKSPEETANEIMQNLKEKGIWSGTVKNIKKDGTAFWCHAKVSTFNHHEFGDVWISVHEDITGQKQKQEQT